MNIVRWNPRREMFRMQHDMDRLMDSFFQTNSNGKSGFGLAIDVAETEAAYEIAAVVPGVNADDIEITFDNNVLTIQGESQTEEAAEGTRYHIRERRYGRFSRSIRLPEGIEANHISADYNAGILKVYVPKAEVVQPKRITVNVANDDNTAEDA